MRAFFLSAAIGLAVVPASAQSFRLVDPALTVDGRRVGVVGAPLAQEAFGGLALAVPGTGTYRVSDHPFTGSQRVGQFEGDGLYFALDGRSVRLRSAGPILDREGPAPAHVRFDAGDTGSARGLARVSLADASGTTARGPAPSPRPASDPRAEADALRDALDRAVAERTALAAERDRLRAERGTAPRPTGDAYADALSRSTMLDAETARLRAERDQLVETRDRATADRTRLAADLDAALRRADAAESVGNAAQARTADAEVNRLRTEIVARDQTIAALRIESDDRRIRLAETDAELARTQRALAAMTAERDAARSERDVARRERDAARPTRTGAPSADRAALLADRAALDADRALLADARARFEADRAAASRTPSALTSDQLGTLADRQRALDDLATAQAERDALALQVAALQTERDRLRTSVDRLTADLATERLVSDRLRAEQRPADAPRPPAADLTPDAYRPADVAPRRTAAVSFPGFDFSRLTNPDQVRRRLDEAEYPHWAVEGNLSGDVLVLFQTDASGRVIRTAVASPIGGGLDALAESLVRDMQFVPPVVDGMRTGLRSQVLVRFVR